MGTVTWGVERMPPADAIWAEELDASGARVRELPEADNRRCCDTSDKVAALLEGAGFDSTRVWIESLHHRWRPEDHFDYQLRSGSLLRLLSLPSRERDSCVRRVRDRLSGQGMGLVQPGWRDALRTASRSGSSAEPRQRTASSARKPR